MRLNVYLAGTNLWADSCLVCPRKAQAELHVRRYNSKLIGRVRGLNQDSKSNRITDERMRKGLIAA